MSYHGSNGLEWQGIGYGPGRYGLGDVDSATASRVLKAALLASPATYAIAYMDRTGKVTKVDTYGTKTEMLQVWDAMVQGDAIPSTIQEVRSIRKEGMNPDDWIWDIAVNPAVSKRIFSRINWKSAAPWILGAGALIAAAVYLKKGGKKTRGRARRASWRRRTITVWR